MNVKRNCTKRRRTCESTSSDKADSGVTVIIADESSPMSEEAWNYMTERAAARKEERRG